MGWFYGFKLHLICNVKGDLLNFMVTPGNVDDREPLRNKSFIEQIFGKLMGDKGYICKDLFSKLFVDGIQLITKLKYSFFPKKPMIDVERVSPYENGVVQLEINWL